MKIHVGTLSEGVHEYRFETDGEGIALGPGIAGSVVVDARLEKTGKQIYLTAAAKATGSFSCDRCLAGFQQELAPRYRMTYLLDVGEAEQFDPAEVQVISPSLTVIDITEDVRQTLLLAVPLKLLCRDECRGLCPICGANRNTVSCECTDQPADSRWDALKNLRTEN
jgi:uncharacterized protein